MARLPRYQESGLVAGDIPRLDFANLKEESRVMAGVGESLDRLSQFAFGEAKKETDRVNKLTAIQVRSELEGEVQKRMAELKMRVDSGEPPDYASIQTEIQSFIGYADGLKGLDIEQANGLISSIRTSGKVVLSAAADRISKANQDLAKLRIDDLNSVMATNIQTVLEVEKDPEVFKAYVGASRGVVSSNGILANVHDDAMKGFDKSLESAISGFTGSYLRNSANINKSYLDIINGRSGDANIDALSKDPKYRGLIVDAAKKQLAEYRDQLAAENDLISKDIKTVTADFDMALASGDGKAQSEALSKLRILAPDVWAKKSREKGEAGDQFSSFDHGFAIAEMSSKVGSVSGQVLTEDDVNKYRRYLTPSRYTEYMNTARGLAEPQTQALMKEAKARLGILIGNPMDSSAARIQNEKVANAVYTKWSAAKRNNPSVDPVQWLDDNIDSIAKSVKKVDNAASASVVAGRSIRTVSGFDEAIRKAAKDPVRTAQLIKERAELIAAQAAGLVDQNGNMIGGKNE